MGKYHGQGASRLAAQTGRAPYVRRVLIQPAAGLVTAEMEDYFHHFVLRIQHDGASILEVDADAVRAPWTTCPGGLVGLRALVGLSLPDARRRSHWASERTANCVHTVELALMAANHALDVRQTRYDVAVTPAAGTRRVGWVTCNGSLRHRWVLGENTVTEPAALAGLGLAGPAFVSRVRQGTDPSDREAALVLRRACLIAGGRDTDLDAMESADQAMEPNDSCYTYQHAVALRARRNMMSQRQLPVRIPEPRLRP